jgi:predicted nucleic acid-binding protein
MQNELIGGFSPNLEEMLHSDLLPKLVALIEEFPVLKPLFPKLLQLRLVVDANRVRGELYWRLKKRRNAANRSALHEVIDAGVLIFFAPEHVKWEIEKHYEDIARQTRTTIVEVKDEWAKFQHCLRFYAPKTQPSPEKLYADVDDFPYLATWMELDTQAIYTTDPHLSAMGAPVVSVLIDTPLRDYARASTVQIALGIGSSISVVAGLEFLQAAYRLLMGFIKAIRRLSPAAQMLLAAGAAIFIAHPKGRKTLKDGWNTVIRSEVLLALGDAIADFMVQAAQAAKKAKASCQIVEAALLPAKKRPLRLHARAVCTAAGSPLTLGEMERQIRRGGYVSSSQTFRAYLHRVLQADDALVEVQAGQWTLRSGLRRQPSA